MPSTTGVAESAGGVDDYVVSVGVVEAVLASVDVPYTCANTGLASMNAAIERAKAYENTKAKQMAKGELHAFIVLPRCRIGFN